MIKPKTLVAIYINICINKLNRKINLSIEYKKAYINYAFLCYAKIGS